MNTKSPDNTGQPASQGHDHSIEHHKQEWQKHGLTRRVFLRSLALVGGVALADQISAGQLSGLFTDHSHDEDPADIEEHAQEIVREFDHQHEGQEMSAQERTQRFIDYLGCAVFGTGVGALLRGKSISTAHYVQIGLLSAFKYENSDQHGKEHLREETIASAKALGIIAGTMVAAEGLNADMEKAYQMVNGRIPEPKDRIAVMCMLASGLSPLATTVGSATVLKKLSNDLVAQKHSDGTTTYDEAMMADCTSHISDLSGYLLFGDPPFIAMVEKYGFKNAIQWQFKAMLPLYLYSLLSAMYKLNLTMAKRAGKVGKEAHKTALRDAWEGLARNIPFMISVFARTTQNAIRYIGMQKDQDPRGVEFWIGEQLQETLKNLGKLPFSAEFDREEAEKGIVHGEDERHKVSVDRVLHNVLRKMASGHRATQDTPFEGTLDADDDDQKSAVDREHRIQKIEELGSAFQERRFDRVRELAAELGIGDGIEHFIETVQAFDAENQPDGIPTAKPTTEGLMSFLRNKLNPVNLYRRTFDIDRIKSAVGHNLGDVLNVFPFQAGCVPFLVTAFDDAKNVLQKNIAALPLPQIAKDGTLEAAMYLLIGAFSMFADNYVACKVGLELFPKKPQLPLSAAIQGGSMTSVGNMANVAQFDLAKFSLPASLRQYRRHLDHVGVGFAWSFLLGRLQNFGVMTAPTVKQKTVHPGHEHAEANSIGPVDAEQKNTRRAFFRSLFG